ncbi:MAG: glycoside hydrolase family 19 protein, partial [Myxococcota bacterium]
LRKGRRDSGAVAEVKGALVQLGLLTTSEVNGNYDDKMVAAVKAFAGGQGSVEVDGTRITADIAIAMVRKLAMRQDRDKRFGVSLQGLTREIVAKHPDVAREIFRRAEEVRTLQRGKDEALAQGWQELKGAIDKLAPTLSPESQQAWTDLRRQVDAVRGPEGLRRIARAGYELSLGAALASFDASGDPARNPQLEEWLTRIEKTLAALDAGGAGPKSVTPPMFRAIAPTVSIENAALYAPLLNAAMQDGGITGRLQQAAFIAQLAHESGGFRYLAELGSGSGAQLVAYFNAKYSHRADMENKRGTDDGYRFRGRGFIQLTGRKNYRLAGAALFPDNPNFLLKHPDEAAKPEVAFRVAVWYWQTNRLSSVLGEGDERAYRAVTRRINGGYNGLEDRVRYYDIAREELAA